MLSDFDEEDEEIDWDEHAPEEEERETPEEGDEEPQYIGQEWYPYEEEDGEASVLKEEDPEEGEEEPEEEQ